MISNDLKQVILSELDLDQWELTDETTADQVPGWDSLNHARVIIAVEDAFHVRFHTGEIMRLVNIGQLQALIDVKRGVVGLGV